MPGSAQRQDARRARAGDDLADRLERALGRVQHQVAHRARLDDAAQDRREIASAAVVRLRARDQHGLGREERAERAEPVRAQGVAARDEVDDRVGEPEARRDLDGAGDLDELDLDAVLGQQLPREPRIDRRDAVAVEIGERRRIGDSSGTAASRRARAEAEPEQLADLGAALAHEVGAGDAAVDDAVLDVLGDVGGTHEQHLDRRVPARERERPLAGLLGAEAGVVEQRRRPARAAGPWPGSRSSGALRERRRCRSSASR